MGLVNIVAVVNLKDFSCVNALGTGNRLMEVMEYDVVWEVKFVATCIFMSVR